jgi:hypothetical protein
MTAPVTLFGFFLAAPTVGLVLGAPVLTVTVFGFPGLAVLVLGCCGLADVLEGLSGRLAALAALGSEGCVGWDAPDLVWGLLYWVALGFLVRGITLLPAFGGALVFGPFGNLASGLALGIFCVGMD